jgi:hypothetical protein
MSWGARVAYKEPRVVFRLATPGSKDSEVAAQSIQTEAILATLSPDLDAAAFGMAAGEGVPVHVAAVRRPLRIIEVSSIRKPLRPFLGAEVLQHEFFRNLDVDRRQVVPVGGPAR